MKRMNLAERQRLKAAQRKAKLQPAPKPAPIKKIVEEEEVEDASELEYQEKTTRKKRSYTRRNKDGN